MRRKRFCSYNLLVQFCNMLHLDCCSFSVMVSGVAARESSVGDH